MAFKTKLNKKTPEMTKAAEEAAAFLQSDEEKTEALPGAAADAEAAEITEQPTEKTVSRG